MLQLWYNGPGGIRRRLDDNDDDILPVPFFMADIDAAIGPGVGIGYSTLAFLLINRLWFKFYIGAGGGLALSLCIVSLDNGV